MKRLLILCFLLFFGLSECFSKNHYLRKNIINGINTLTQSMFSMPSTIYHIKYNYDLGGRTITIPEGSSLKFDGGIISNGKLCGSIKNDTIHSSWFSSLSVIKFELTNKVLIIDDNINIKEPIVIKNVSNFEIDGKDHNITCVSCDAINLLGNCSHVNIHNVKFKGDKDYFCIGMNPSTEGKKEYIDIHDNHIDGFRYGVSLNADNAGIVENCRVHHNTIKNIMGEDAGHGYGIHLANANWCLIDYNQISYCQRHSIYHAWGSHNRIENNYISHHRYNLRENARTCIAVFRKSEFVTIKNNYITDCYSLGIHVYSSETNTGHPREGATKNIDIIGNKFINNASTTNAFAMILVGYGEASWDNLSCHGDSINISGNEFVDEGNSFGANIQVFDVGHLFITDNKFLVKNGRNSSISFQEKYRDYWNGIITIERNTVIPMGEMPGYGVIRSSNRLGNAGKLKVKVRDNNLENSGVTNKMNYKLYGLYNWGNKSGNQKD